MILKSFDDKTAWNSTISSFNLSSLLLSWEWGEFQKKLDKNVQRYGLFSENEELIALFYTIEQIVPLNLKYLYAPKAPLVVKQELFDIEEYSLILLDLCKKINAVYLKTDIVYPALLSCAKFKKVQPLQPEKTLILDLSPSEEELLASFHHKTRYNIKLAQRKGVKIRKGTSKDINPFIHLLNVTTERDSFVGHSTNYYERLLNDFPNFAQLMIGEYEGKILCANIMTYYGDTVTYLHGASSNEDRNVMAPLLLQWECIKEAKTLGYRYYDFWGIDEKKWPGVTRFKRGFVNETNGLEPSYPGTFDLVNRNLAYILYRGYKAIRQKI